MLRRVLTFLGMYVAFSALAAFILLLNFLPYHPNSLTGWLILFAVALPLTIAGEAIGNFLFSNPIARIVNAKTEAHSFSWLRILFILITMLLFFGLAFVVAHWLGWPPHGPLAP